MRASSNDHQHRTQHHTTLGRVGIVLLALLLTFAIIVFPILAVIPILVALYRRRWMLATAFLVLGVAAAINGSVGGSVAKADDYTPGCTPQSAGYFYYFCASASDTEQPGGSFQGSVDGQAVTAKRTVNGCQRLDTGYHLWHRCTGSWRMCAPTPAFGCYAWAQYLRVTFLYDGRQVKHVTPVDCSGGNTAGYSVTVDVCHWVDVYHNPAPYGHGEHITGQVRFQTHVGIKALGIVFTWSHAISAHIYGSGGAYAHPNAGV